jgi:2-polyprenyl-3-methyl-5-hydroxy-6-metoxy-1,4-benzoquinol methylase
LNAPIQFLNKVPMVLVVMGRENLVLEKCYGKRVLHLGCVDEGLTIDRIQQGKHLHMKLREVASNVFGLDISKDGLNVLKELGVEQLFEGDVEKLQEIPQLRNEVYDVILASEIIEHLNNPGLFLEGVKQYFNSETEMIITTPNAVRITGLWHQLHGYEFVHPDHTCWYSYHTLLNLLKRYDFRVKEFYGYSMFDVNTPIITKIYRRIRNHRKRILVNHHATNSLGTDKFESISTKVNLLNILNIIFRRYLYKRNPFFSDGLIAVVKYEYAD